MCKFCYEKANLSRVANNYSITVSFCPVCGRQISTKNDTTCRKFIVPLEYPNGFDCIDTLIFNDVESITSVDSPIYNLDYNEFDNCDSLDIYESRFIGKAIIKKTIDVSVKIE